MAWRAVLISFFIVITVMLAPRNAQATEYLFAVTCPDRRVVAEWKTGDVDPGREYLRVATGINNPGCSISDYNDTVDREAPRVTYSHEGGIIAGIPFVGMIACRWFSWC